MNNNTYNETGVLQEFRWACILRQATALHLHNNNRLNLPISDYEADQRILLPPIVMKISVRAMYHLSLRSKLTKENRIVHGYHDEPYENK